MLRLEEVKIPAPDTAEILIEASVAGVNFADTGMRRGMFHGPREGGPPATPGFAGRRRGVRPRKRRLRPRGRDAGGSRPPFGGLRRVRRCRDGGGRARPAGKVASSV